MSDTQAKRTQTVIEWLGDDVGELQKRVGALEYLQGLDDGDHTDTGLTDNNDGTDSNDESDDVTDASPPEPEYPAIDFWSDVQTAFRQPLTGLEDNSHVDLTEIVLILRADVLRLAETVELQHVY